MKQFSLLILFLSSICFTFCEIEDPVSPVSSGAEGAEIIPSNFTKVYETSFENVSKKNSQELTWDFPHMFEFAARHQEDGGTGNGLGGARMWVDTLHAHTGNKSIGLEVFDIEKSRRSEFVISPKNYVSKEYYISYWLFLPANWGLFDPNIDWDWFEIGDPYTSKGLPYSAIFITKPDDNQQYYSVSLGTRDQLGILTSTEEKRISLPKNRWFQICYYVRRDVIDGAIKVWFDGQLIADKSGFPTAHTLHNDFNVSIAKIYYERGDKIPHQLWIDDLTLYTKVP